MNANEALARMDYLHNMMNTTTTYYRRKFYEEMKGLYEEFAAVRAAWDFVEDAVRIVKRFVKKILTVFHNDKRVEFHCEAAGCGAYLVQHFDYKNNPKWIKVGKADDVDKRLSQHLKQDYAGEVKRAVCIAFYPAVDADHALSIENVLRRYFRKNHKLLGKDRFPTLEEVTAADFEYLNAKIEKLAEVFD